MEIDILTSSPLPIVRHVPIPIKTRFTPVNIMNKHFYTDEQLSMLMFDNYDPSDTFKSCIIDVVRYSPVRNSKTVIEFVQLFRKYAPTGFASMLGLYQLKKMYEALNEEGFFGGKNGRAVI